MVYPGSAEAIMAWYLLVAGPGRGREAGDEYIGWMADAEGG